jgi:hypothetical protein
VLRNDGAMSPLPSPSLQNLSDGQATGPVERAGADEDDAFTPNDAIRACLGWPRLERRTLTPADRPRNASPDCDKPA